MWKSLGELAKKKDRGEIFAPRTYSYDLNPYVKTLADYLEFRLLAAGNLIPSLND
jgi:hypothetical protein